MLNLQNINFTFGSNTRLEKKILNNLNLSVKDGEFLSVIGENGAGKSTLFNIISGYVTPDQGSVLIDNVDVTKSSIIERSKFIASVMQEPRIGTVQNMTIEENMNFAYMRDKNRKFAFNSSLERRKLFQNKLKMLDMGLERKLGEQVGNLSGGQRQALSIIMAILGDFKILLLDEITAALDPGASWAIMNIAHRIAKEEKRATIMITHDMAHAKKYSDRLVKLFDGEIRECI